MKKPKNTLRIKRVMPEVGRDEQALNAPKTITITGYGPDGCEEIVASDLSAVASIMQKWPVTWIDIDGLGNTALNDAIAKEFDLDRLVMEDVKDASHFPKIEQYEKFVFIVLKNGVLCEPFETEQISLIVTEKCVITFQERPGDSFNEVRKRIHSGAGRVRRYGSDYLAYALIDAVIMSYHPVLDSVRKRLDEIEDTFLNPKMGSDIISDIHHIKTDLLLIHRAIWPIYDMTLALAHDDMPIVTSATSHFLRDCQDEAKRVTELSEFYRMIAGDLMATYLAFNDYQANSVMKLLTMIATVFIPLSFITGLYGMNFDRSASPYNMPELGYRYGYPAVLLLMLTVAGGFLIMFWRKGWLGSRKP